MSYVVFAPDNAGIRVAERVVRQLLRFARAAHRGVQRGEAPLRSSISPKMEHPSQAEWGTRGLIHNHTEEVQIWDRD